MGYFGDKIIGNRPVLRVIWQLFLIVVMLGILTTLFKTQCIDNYQMGYDDCLANMNKGFEIKQNYYENGSLKNITVVPISPSLTQKRIIEEMTPIS